MLACGAESFKVASSTAPPRPSAVACRLEVPERSFWTCMPSGNTGEAAERGGSWRCEVEGGQLCDEERIDGAGTMPARAQCPHDDQDSLKSRWARPERQGGGSNRDDRRWGLCTESQFERAPDVVASVKEDGTDGVTSNTRIVLKCPQ